MNIKQSADEVRALVRTFKALNDIGAVLDNIVSLEQAVIESTNAADKARKDRDVALAELKDTNGDLQTAKGKVKAEQTKLNAIVEDANAKALDIVKQAEENSIEIISKAEAKKAAVEAEIEALSNRFEEESAALEKVRNQIVEAEKALNGLKQKARQIVGEG